MTLNANIEAPEPAPPPRRADGGFDFRSLLDPVPGQGHVPLYQRLSSGFRASLQNGALPQGFGIPPERELAALLGISRVTVRRAIEELVEQGLLQSRQGSGTFVSARVEQPLTVLGSFSQDMLQRGYAPGSRWLSRELAYPTAEEALALGGSTADRVIRLARVRTADGHPIAVERATVRAELLRAELDFGHSLYAALARHGIVPVRAFQRLRAQGASAEDAALLRVEPGDAVLATERRSFTAQGVAVELTHSVYRGDRYDYLVELRSPSPVSTGEPKP
jgi:GntR family transcriptional regulator